MNILFIGSSADWHVELWVQHFTKDHQVYLFSDKEDYLKDQKFNNVKIFHSEGYLGKALNFFNIKSHLLFQINKLISAKNFAVQVESLIEENNIEIVHAHSLYYGFLLSFIKSNIPIVFTPMGSDIIIHAQKNHIYKYMALRIFNRTSVVTGDSVLLQKRGYMIGAKQEYNYIIQNGVDSNIFFPKINGLKQHFKVLDDEILLFSPRAITHIYNIDIIIDAVAQLKYSGYKVKCMFAFAFGDQYFNELKEQAKKLDIENIVIWLGFLTYEEMAEYYNASDIVISVPSSDSSPKSVYEAMFCKKPIVVTNLEWSYELLGESNCLKRVAVRNVLELSNTISSLIDNDDLRMQISSNALKYAHKYFDYKNNMMRMEQIMFDAIKRN